MGIILASSSPRRRELMALITPDYTVRTSDVDERAIRAETPALLARSWRCQMPRRGGELP
ncbi:MAG: Maf family protein [Ruthenibacterium lactatiformans]